MKRIPLGRCADVKISGVDKKTHENETPVRLCNYTDVYYNWAVTDNHYDGFMRASATKAEVGKFKIRKGQVALTKDSETREDIGKPTLIAADFDDVVLGYHCALITPDEKQLNGKYLNALLHTEYVKRFFANNAGGSGQRYYLSDTNIKDLPLFLPDLPEQRKIGKFLSSIDRLIELSRKRIENLEKLAKEIYDYWFVQFDFPDKRGKPYKNSGGKMVYNAELKREIPAGWIVKRFGDLVSISEGQVNPQKMGDRQLEHYSIPAYDDSRYPVMERASSILSNKFKVTAEAFLVSKLNPQFKRLWDPVCVTADAVCSTEFIVCRSKDEINKPFNYGVADSEAFQIYMRQRSSSSTGSRKRLDPKEILKFKLAMPLDNVLLNKFNKLAGDCLAMIKESRKGIHDLTQLREFLLPLLMNGRAKMN